MPIPSNLLAQVSASGSNYYPCYASFLWDSGSYPCYAPTFSVSPVLTREAGTHGSHIVLYPGGGIKVAFLCILS